MPAAVEGIWASGGGVWAGQDGTACSRSGHAGARSGQPTHGETRSHRIMALKAPADTGRTLTTSQRGRAESIKIDTCHRLSLGGRNVQNRSVLDSPRAGPP